MKPSSQTDSPKQALLLGLLVFLVFGLALWAPFIYDDVLMIQKNPDVIGIWQGWSHFFLKPFSFEENYEPMSLLIHRGLFLLGGAQPVWFRLSNIALHWLDCVLVLLLFERLLGPEAPSFWLAALFAIYPSHTENIAVGTFKKHILVALWGLLMLFSQRPWTDEKPTWRRRLACAALLVLGLFSKENAAVLPFILAAFSLALAPSPKDRLKREGWFFAALVGIDLTFLYWRSIVVPRSGALLVGDSLSSHLLTAAKCLVWYFREFLLPVRLCQEHSISVLGFSPSWQLAAVLGALGGLAAFAAWLWRRDRVAFAGLALATLWLVPFLNLIPYLNLSLVANRYIYLSMAGVLLCAGSLSRPWWNAKIGRFRALPLACSLIGLAYAGLAMNNLSHYSDPNVVWERAACCAPDNPRALSSLASAYVTEERYGDAERALRAAARLGDNGGFSVGSTAALGALWAQTGKIKPAAFLYISLSRHYMPALPFGALGAGLLKGHYIKQATLAFRQALFLDPHDSFSRVNLGACYSAKGKTRLAEIEWRSVAGSDPDAGATAHKDLAILYAKQKRLDRARQELAESLAANPLQLDTTALLATLDAQSGQPEAGLAAIDALIGRLRQGQPLALRETDALTKGQRKVAAAALAVALKQRSQFLAKHPKLVASKA